MLKLDPQWEKGKELEMGTGLARPSKLQARPSQAILGLVASFVLVYPTILKAHVQFSNPRRNREIGMSMGSARYQGTKKLIFGMSLEYKFKVEMLLESVMLLTPNIFLSISALNLYSKPC